MRNTTPKCMRYEKNLPEEWVSKITCFICVERVSLPNKIFKNQNKCAHPICVKCMIKYINTKLDHGLHRIKCPVLNCAHYLDPVSCRPDIPSRVFNRWCDLLCEFAVLRIDKCYCPNKKCSTLILNECRGNTTVRKSKCPDCKKLFCFSCKVAWHEGYSCKKAKQLDWHDVASGVLAEIKNWKRCPTCHHCVERVGGCFHVICRCGTCFCYDCGRNVQGPHHCGIRYTSESDAFLFWSFAIASFVVLFVFIVTEYLKYR